MSTRNFANVLRQKIAEDEGLRERIADAQLAAQIATEIYNARMQAKLTQAKLADLTGMKQSVIARLEDADYGAYSLRTLKRIARALGMKLRVDFFHDSMCHMVQMPEFSIEFSDSDNGQEWTFGKISGTTV